MGFPKFLTAGVLAALLVPTSAQSAAVAQDDSVWTLRRCEQAALAASPTLAGSRARADAARAGADAAKAGGLPQVGLTGQVGYVTETMKLEMPTLAGPRSIEFGDGSNTDLMLGVRAPLFQGGSLQANQRSAAAGYEAQLAAVASDSLSLQLQVRRAFYAALGSEATAGAARQGETRLRRHLDDVQKNIAAGMATEEARLQVLARLRHTEQVTLQAEADAATSRFRLGRLVGLAGSQVRPGADLAATLLSGSEQERPWDQRPALRAMSARVEQADQSAQAAAGSLWPAVDLAGGWHYGKPGIDAVSNEYMDYGTVALNLRWTLFDFGGRNSQVQSLRAHKRAAAAAQDDVQDALLTRQAAAETQLEAARRQAARAAERSDLESRRLALVQERWRAGHATENEILDAHDDVTMAVSDLATAEARLRLAEAELLAALGW